MDRCIVSCYDSEVGAHLSTVTATTSMPGHGTGALRCSMNLNSDFEGGDVIFPEFGSNSAIERRRAGRRRFRAVRCTEVTPVTRGRRYAFLAFLYGEEDVKTRIANNARLHEGELQYPATVTGSFRNRRPRYSMPAVA